MINMVLGGTHSGKTTFVREHFLGESYGHDKLLGVPVSIANSVCAIGHYNRPARTCGVDQMGYDYPKIHGKILAFLYRYSSEFHTIVMEGNAITCDPFMGNLRSVEFRNAVKLWLMDTPAEVVQARLKITKVKYGQSIIKLSYKRAFQVWNDYKGVFIHELVTGQS